MSQAVCSPSGPTSFASRANFEYVSGGALVSAHLRGAARCVFTGPFAASLWGCPKRLARFHAQHPLLSQQTSR
eukprot:8882813-Pyramimonas_sp.AAC.1